MPNKLFCNTPWAYYAEPHSLFTDWIDAAEWRAGGVSAEKPVLAPNTTMPDLSGNGTPNEAADYAAANFCKPSLVGFGYNNRPTTFPAAGSLICLLPYKLHSSEIGNRYLDVPAGVQWSLETISNPPTPASGTGPTLVNYPSTNLGGYHILRIQASGFASLASASLKKAGETKRITQNFRDRVFAFGFTGLRGLDAWWPNADLYYAAGTPKLLNRPAFTEAHRPTAGWCWEAIVEVANDTNTHPVFLIPIDATDGYVTALATYAEANLNPWLTAYYFRDNEIWNLAFWATAVAVLNGMVYRLHQADPTSTTNPAPAAATDVKIRTAGHTYSTGDFVYNYQAGEAIYYCAAGTATQPPTDGSSNANWTYLGNSIYACQRYYAKRSVADAATIAAVYGGGKGTRYRLGCTQQQGASFGSGTDYGTHGLRLLWEGYYQLVDEYWTAEYSSGSLFVYSATTVAIQTATPGSARVNAAFAELNNAAAGVAGRDLSIKDGAAAAALVATRLAAFKAQYTDHGGLAYGSYEGSVSPTVYNTWGSNPASISAVNDRNSVLADSRFQDVVEDFYALLPSGTHTYYMMGGKRDNATGDIGDWGAQQDQDDFTSPRAAALISIAALSAPNTSGGELEPTLGLGGGGFGFAFSFAFGRSGGVGAEGGEEHGSTWNNADAWNNADTWVN